VLRRGLSVRDRLRARFDFYVERFGVEAEATS
jgi:hypothetical protein